MGGGGKPFSCRLRGTCPTWSKQKNAMVMLISHYPQSLQVFLRHGFGPLANPVLRKTMARVVSIEQACRREGVDLAELLAELRNVEISDKPATSGLVVPITRIAS